MMEMFVAERSPAEAAALAKRLKALGLRGRDAAYLASVAPPPAEPGPESVRYFEELDFMVPPPARAAVRALLGLQNPAGATGRKAA
jgi:hypothetical protein